MLQGSSGHNNTVNSNLATAVSLIRNMSPQNKLLVGTGIVLSLLLIVGFASATHNAASKQDNSLLPAQIQTESSSTVESKTSSIPSLPEENHQVETNINVTSSSSINGETAGTEVQLQVNGQEIEVPPSGQLNQSIVTEGGDTVQVKVQTDLNSNENNGRSRIRIDSESESEVRIRNR